MFLTKEASASAFPGSRRRLRATPPLGKLFGQYADAGGELLGGCAKARRVDEAELVPNARLRRHPTWEWISDERSTVFGGRTGSATTSSPWRFDDLRAGPAQRAASRKSYSSSPVTLPRMWPSPGETTSVTSPPSRSSSAAVRSASARQSESFSPT